jgi:hypothetical protein
VIPYSAFLNGIKPAYLCSPNTEKDRFYHLKNAGYPFVELSGDRILFFASEKIKLYYLQKATDNAEIALGEALGYPPIAAKFFVDIDNNPALKSKRAYFSYAGMNFVGNFDDAVDIAIWLWQNINYPVSPVKITYQRETYRLFPERVLPTLQKPAIL